MRNIVIIGAGPAGIMAAYQLAVYGQDKDINITVIDKGRDIVKRICPVREGKKCVKCKPCNIMCGFGGAGTFSDCKLSLCPSSGVGGDIKDYLGDKEADSYAKCVNNILYMFSDYKNNEIVGQDKDDNYVNLENKLKSVGLDLTYNPTKHIGTDGTYKIMEVMLSYLRILGVNFIFDTEVTDIQRNHKGEIVVCTKHNEYIADYTILATGRSGNKWMANIMKEHGAEVKTEKFDVGYRIELPYDVLKELTDNFYDMKISSIEEVDGEYYKVRTFCTNPKGYVSEERYNGVVLANGHSYANKKSNNTNFAVLVTLPYDGSGIVNKYNTDTHCRLTLQSFTDLQNGTITDYLLEPTLKDFVTFKELKEKEGIKPYIPDYINKAIISFLQKLDTIYPGVCKDSTLLYGLEAKFYSDIIKVNDVFKCVDCDIDNIYCIGDGAGLTRGIIQSGCQGLVVADNIIIELSKDGIK